MSEVATLGEVTDRINQLAYQDLLQKAVPMPEQRIAAIEARLADIVQTLRDMREDHRIAMAEIQKAQGSCRERCDGARGAVYDRIREIESEQMVNKGAHDVIDKEKARHPHVQVADRTGMLVIATLALVIADIVLKIWRG